MLKFRTMFEGADRQKAALEETNEAGGALFKIRDDPRITAVGRFRFAITAGSRRGTGSATTSCRV